MDDLDQWLDAPIGGDLPDLKSPDDVDRWLDAPPEKPKLNDADIDAFLEAKPGDDTGSFMRGFKGALQQQLPEDVASAIEGVGVLTGLGEPIVDADGNVISEGTKIPEYLRDLAQSGVQYERQIPSYTDIENLGDVGTYIAESAGAGVGSTVPSLISGGVGGYLGSRAIKSKYGTAGGTIAGAALPSAAQNFGSLYSALLGEGVPKEKAAEYAAAATGPIVALDVAGPTSWLSRLTGDGRREVMRALAKRIAQEAAKGTAVEAGTEALQTGIEKGTVSAATGKDLFTADNARDITDAFLQGGLGGGLMGGASGVARDRPTAAGETAPTPPGAVPTGQTVGIQTPAGPIRVRVESEQDGNVFYTTPDGVTYGMPVEDFTSSIVPPPPAADEIRGDATTVPEPTPRPAPVDYGDINDFDPNREAPPAAPPPPSPQQAMPLADTRAIDRAAMAAREFRKAAVEAQDAERRAYLNQQADALDNEAMDLRRQLAARSDTGGQGVPAAEVRARAGLGRLGEAAPAVSEAVTGPVPVDTRQPQTELERAAPAISEAITGPEVQRVRPKPTVWQLIRQKAARLNDPQSIARQTGMSVEQVNAVLSRVAARPNGPIRQVRGKVTTDPKTGMPVQSKRSGMLTYVPQRTTPMSLLEAISAAGGAQDRGADLASMGADTWHRGKVGKKPLINERGIAWDELGDWAEQEGFLPPRGVDETTGENYHRDPAEVLEMIRRELGGQKQLPLDADVPVSQPDEPTATQRREYEVTRDLGRLQEEFDPGAALEDLEAQLNERLGMMEAATVDEAVDMMNAELDAIDRIMEETYDGWNADTEARAGAPEAVSETAGGPEVVGAREGTGPESDVDRGAAGRGTAAETEGGVDVNRRTVDRLEGTRAPTAGNEKVSGRQSDQSSGEFRSSEGQHPDRPVSVHRDTGTRSSTDETASASQFMDRASDKQDAAERWVAGRGRATGNEHNVTFDETAKVLSAATSGRADATTVSADTLAAMIDPKNNLVAVHNHPNDGPLSGQDLEFLFRLGLRTVSAVGNNGSVSRARLSVAFREALYSVSPQDALTFVKQAINEAQKMASDTLESHTGGTVGSYEFRNRLLDAVGLIEYESSHANPALALENGATVFRTIANRLHNKLQSGNYPVKERDNAGSISVGVHRSSARERPVAGIEEISGVVGDVASGQPTGTGVEPAVQRPSGREGQAVPDRTNEAVSGPKDLRAESTEETRSLVSSIFDRFRRRPGTAREAARAAHNVVQNVKGPPELAKLGKLSNLIAFAATVASKDTTSARYYTAEKALARYAEALTRDGARATQSYYSDQIGHDGRAKINKVLEYDRLEGVNRQDTGNRVVVRIPDDYKGQLGKPGEVVTLNAVESRALSELRKFFDERLTLFGKAMARQFGWIGPFDEAAMRRAVKDTTNERSRNEASRAIEIYQMIEEMRRAGYVPFARYGDTKISIRPKPKYEPGKDGMQFGKAVHVELVPTSELTDVMFDKPANREGRGAVQKRRKELERDFPPDQYDYEVTPLNTLADVRKVDLPAVEKMFMMINMKTPEMGPKFYEEIIKQIFEERKSGFRRRSNNVPGYSVDFERAIADYIHQTSNVVARMELGKDVNRAFEATQSHQDRDIAKFWKDYRDYVETPGDDYPTLRKVAFWSFIWGSLSSAAVNLTQTPLVTAFQSTAWAGPRAVPTLGDAITEVLMAATVNKDGLTLNWQKIGRTDAERRMIAQLRDEGVLDPIIARDLQGYDRGTSPSNRKWRRQLERGYEIGASAFNVAEMANRAGAALGTFRLAQNPQTLAKARKVYAQDAEFRQMVGRNGTPLDMARFMVDETQFMGGKRGRPRVMRGAGAVVLQWKQYQANWMRLLFKNMTRMGPEGKLAGTAMLLGLVGAAGMLAVPFAEDALDLTNWAIKTATGIDPLLERRMAKWLRDAGLGEVGAEIAMRGPSREYLGIDLSSRIGMGEMAPDGTIENAFPLLGATVGKLGEVWQRASSGQPLGAAAALLPKGAADIAKAAAVFPEEGYRTKRGDVNLFPQEITAGQQLARLFGFQPTEFSRKSEYKYAQRQLAAATQEASSKLLSNVASELALATTAKEYGDEKAYQRHIRRYTKLLRDNAEELSRADIPGWLKIPQPAQRAIKMRLEQIMEFDRAILKRTGKMKREEMMDYPLPTE